MILRSAISEASSVFKSLTIKSLMVALAAMVILGMHGTASAATLVYQPNDPTLEGLDHHNVYAWKITNVNTSIPGFTNGVNGQVVTSASLAFSNIRNWGTVDTVNKLFLHLLDTAVTGTAIAGNTVSPGNTSLGTDNAIQYAYKVADDPLDQRTIQDHLAVNPSVNTYLAPVATALVANGTANTPLGDLYDCANNSGSVVVAPGASSTTVFGAAGCVGMRQEGYLVGAGGDATHSFLIGTGLNNSVGTNYTYDFTTAQIAKLNSYIFSGGDFAIALDPDCHFFNDGITLTLMTGNGVSTNAVPEPASLTLMGLGFAAMYARRRKQQATAKVVAQTL